VKSHYDFSKAKRGPVVRVPRQDPDHRFGSMTEIVGVVPQQVHAPVWQYQTLINGGVARVHDAPSGTSRENTQASFCARSEEGQLTGRYTRRDSARPPTGMRSPRCGARGRAPGRWAISRPGKCNVITASVACQPGSSCFVQRQGFRSGS